MNWKSHQPACDEQVNGPIVMITSFGFLHGSPVTNVTVTLDVRDVLRDPIVDPALRELTGFDEDIERHVRRTFGLSALVTRLSQLTVELVRVRRHVPSVTDNPIGVAVGCGGGRHRAVVVARDLAERLLTLGVSTHVDHRDVLQPVVTRDQYNDR